MPDYGNRDTIFAPTDSRLQFDKDTEKRRSCEAGGSIKSCRTFPKYKWGFGFSFVCCTGGLSDNQCQLY